METLSHSLLMSSDYLNMMVDNYINKGKDNFKEIIRQLCPEVTLQEISDLYYGKKVFTGWSGICGELDCTTCTSNDVLKLIDVE